eukprot:3275058-Rhodomonas_salina.2
MMCLPWSRTACPAHPELLALARHAPPASTTSVLAHCPGPRLKIPASNHFFTLPVLVAVHCQNWSFTGTETSATVSVASSGGSCLTRCNHDFWKSAGTSGSRSIVAFGGLDCSQSAAPRCCPAMAFSVTGESVGGVSRVSHPLKVRGPDRGGLSTGSEICWELESEIRSESEAGFGIGSACTGSEICWELASEIRSESNVR